MSDYELFIVFLAMQSIIVGLILKCIDLAFKQKDNCP